MRFKSFRVTNFRSIQDSGECTLDQVLCLVGKNEAGKTALLLALAGLNPHPSAPVEYDKERDYPRLRLTEYDELHPDEAALVISTRWEIEDEEYQTILDALGSGALNSREIVATRRYGAKAPEFKHSINFKKVIAHLITSEKVPVKERQLFEKAGTTDELRKTLEGLSPRTEAQERLLQRINKLPSKSATGLVHSVLLSCLPQFLFFSHYDRMDGQLRLDTYAPRATQGQVTPGERVFVDFLEYAGTSVEAILSAKTYEGLNAKCEAASNRISQQLLEYWTQNPHLEIDVRVTKAEPEDEPPFDEGTIARARVKNNLHKVSVPFSERSAGFIWFFSFLVKFAQVRKEGATLVLLLDEPGLTLHGKAQSDLLRYFEEKLAPQHQVIFSTHSPFMVPADKLPSVRIVEDRIAAKAPGYWTSEGTKVRADSLAVDRDTLFPLQGALGYEVTQALFVGKYTLLVEGPGDILFLQALSAALSRRGKSAIDTRWTLCPSGGIDKIQPFVSLFSGANLNVAALTDYAKRDARKLESLKQNNILSDERLMNFAAILGEEEADVEDIFSPALFLRIVNAAFGLPKPLTVEDLQKEGNNEGRLLKKIEACFRVMPPSAPPYSHYKPAEWIFLNPSVLDEESTEVAATLGRAEKVILAVNNALVP